MAGCMGCLDARRSALMQSLCFSHLTSAARRPLQQARPLLSLRHFAYRQPAGRNVRAQSAAQQLATRERVAAPTFHDLRVGDDLIKALSELRIERPTEIQSSAIPAILKGGDVLLASHTGSGKTLAYLLPLVKMLRETEVDGGSAARPRRPLAVVLGPTRELTDQILRVAKSLSHHARFRSACINGGGTWAQQAAALGAPLDLLVATPQRAQQHAEKGHLFWGDVRWLVLDEADTMFDVGFGPEVRAALRALRGKPTPAAVVAVMATLTPPVKKLLAREFPDMQSVATSSLHRGVAGARHAFLPCPPATNKLDTLAQVVEGEARRRRRVLVFCNTLASCRAAGHHLAERGLAALTYHGDIPLGGRKAAIDAFCAGAEGASLSPVLVATDLAARGLDMPAAVDHVVNFDFPLNPVDYLHRTGRTARAGAPGRITSLVAKRDQVLAGRIERALQANLPLDELSAERAVLPPDMRPKPATLERRADELRAEKHSRRGVRGAARSRMTHATAKPGRAAAKPGRAAAKPGRAAAKPGSAAGRKQRISGSLVPPVPARGKGWAARAKTGNIGVGRFAAKRSVRRTGRTQKFK